MDFEGPEKLPELVELWHDAYGVLARTLGCLPEPIILPPVVWDGRLPDVCQESRGRQSY